MLHYLKPALFSLIAIVIGFVIYRQTSSDFNFEHFNESTQYQAKKIKAKPQLAPQPKGRTVFKKIPKVTSQNQAPKEYISNDKAIKSCNLILKSKLSTFKKLDAFLSSPCSEVAGQQLKISTDEEVESLNWIQFYQTVNNGLEALSFKQKEQLKNKLIIQLSNPGNLIQTSVLSDILITIMKKHNLPKTQEIERLNDEMSAEVEYLGNSSVDLDKNDPAKIKIYQQEVRAVERFRRQFRLIMDIR